EVPAPPALEVQDQAAVPAPSVQEAMVPETTAPAPVDVAEPEVAAAHAAAPVAPVRPAPARRVAPRIVSRRPAGRAAFAIVEGEALDFDVRAVDSGSGKLAYVWRVNGRPAARSRSFRFVVPPVAVGTVHVISVEVSETSGLKAKPVSWKLVVTPRLT